MKYSTIDCIDAWPLWTNSTGLKNDSTNDNHKVLSTSTLIYLDQCLLVGSIEVENVSNNLDIDAMVLILLDLIKVSIHRAQLRIPHLFSLRIYYPVDINCDDNYDVRGELDKSIAVNLTSVFETTSGISYSLIPTLSISPSLSKELLSPSFTLKSSCIALDLLQIHTRKWIYES